MSEFKTTIASNGVAFHFALKQGRYVRISAKEFHALSAQKATPKSNKKASKQATTPKSAKRKRTTVKKASIPSKKATPKPRTKKTKILQPVAQKEVEKVPQEEKTLHCSSDGVCWLNPLKAAESRLSTKEPHVTEFTEQGRRDYQEDRVSIQHYNTASNRFFSSGSLMLAIFDGHGGANAAIFLKEHYWNAFLEAIEEADSPKEAFEISMKRLMMKWKIESEANNKDTSGSTIISCVLDWKQRKLYSCNLGDSQLAVYDANGKVGFETKMHEVEGEETKAINSRKYYSEHDAKQQDCFSWQKRILGYLAMSRAFGDLWAVYSDCIGRELDYNKFILPSNPDEYSVVLGSDGLFDNLPLKDLMQEFKPDAKIIGKAALSKSMFGIQDNISVIVATTLNV
jgi:serine/threonine protein phosphatase PrpC